MLAAGYARHSASAEARRTIAALVAADRGLSVGPVEIDLLGRRMTVHDVAYARGAVRIAAGSISLPIPMPGLTMPGWAAKPVFGLVGSASAQTADRPFRMAQWPKSDDAGTDGPARPAGSGSATGSGGIDLKIPGGSPAPAPAPSGPVTAGPMTAAPVAVAPAPGAQTPVAGTGSASASDVTVTIRDVTYTIKKIDLTGTSLTNADLLALLDPASPDPAEVRLRRLNAASIVIPQITELHKKLADGSQERGELDQVLLANVVGGRIGAASAAGASIASVGTDPNPILKTGAIQATGLDLALIAHMVASKRSDDAVPLQTLSEALSVNDIAITNPDGTLTIAAISQKGLKARPLKTDFHALQAAASKGTPGDEDAQTARTKAAVDDIASSFEIASFAIDKVLVATKDKKGPLTVAIARMGLDDFSRRSLGGFMLRDFVLESLDVKATVAQLAFAQVGIPTMTRTDADPGTGLATDNVPAVGKADIEKITVDVTTTAPDGTASPFKFALAHLGATSDQTAGRMPSQGTMTIDNLTFDVPEGDGPGARQLAALGYRHLDLSSVMRAAYDPKLETLLVQKFMVSGVDMGSIDLAIDLGNVNKGIMSANQSLAKASALAMLLKRIDLKVVNQGLFDRAFAWKAKQDGKTVAEERDSAIDLVSVAVPESLGNGPGIKAIGVAVAAFIAEPKTLHIGVASKDGLGISDMALLNAPADLLSHLDIQAEANQ